MNLSNPRSLPKREPTPAHRVSESGEKRARWPTLGEDRRAGGRSSTVHSSQTAVHVRLASTLTRHRRRAFERPIAAHTEASWKAIRRILSEAPLRPIVLDAGCGTGASTHRLAEQHPAAWVLGIDRSAHRLGTTDITRRGQVVLARADLGDLYRLMAAEGVRLGAHYLLYPNPWPKPDHLGRRWHGHPAFFDLLSLGGRLEARSNWRLYLEELAWAIRWVTGASAEPSPISGEPSPLTPFERKYAASGHTLYRLQVCLRTRDAWLSSPWLEGRRGSDGPRGRSS